MDLSTVEINETTEVKILHPVTGLETDIVITMYTTDSAHYKAIIHKLQNQRLYNKRAKPTAEQVEETSMTTIAECTKSWVNVLDGKKEIKCSTKSALKLYKEHEWIFDQVNIDMADRANFLKVVPVN